MLGFISAAPVIAVHLMQFKSCIVAVINQAYSSITKKSIVATINQAYSNITEKSIVVPINQAYF